MKERAMSVFMIGIGGVTNGGKSTLCNQLTRVFGDCGCEVRTIRQDDYFILDHPKVPLPDIAHHNFDVPEAVDFASFKQDLEKMQRDLESWSRSPKRDSLLLLDGNMIYQCPDIQDMMHLKFFFDLPYEECLRRRKSRSYDPPDKPGYFDNYVWPAFEEHREQSLQQQQHNGSKATSDRSIDHRSDAYIVLDGQNDIATILHQSAPKVAELMGPTWTMITGDGLDVNLATKFLSAPSCGGISIFAGITRETENWHKVESLEYEAYVDMALAKMRTLGAGVRSRWFAVERFVAFHRTGIVPVGEPSVIVGASSAHRVDCQQAVSWAIDELKQTIPIWKKELLADGSSHWMENKECEWSATQHRDLFQRRGSAALTEQVD